MIGIKLRDCFAAIAMYAFIRRAATGTVYGDSEEGIDTCKKYAEVAYTMADAMLEVRKK